MTHFSFFLFSLSQISFVVRSDVFLKIWFDPTKYINVQMFILLSSCFLIVIIRSFILSQILSRLTHTCKNLSLEPDDSHSLPMNTQYTQHNLSSFGIFHFNDWHLQVIEDFYRTVAQHFNVTLPHTLQSSIWINLAGEHKRSLISFE
jgi:hypothetical protein